MCVVVAALVKVELVVTTRGQRSPTPLSSNIRRKMMTYELFRQLVQNRILLATVYIHLLLDSFSELRTRRIMYLSPEAGITFRQERFRQAEI